MVRVGIVAFEPGVVLTLALIWDCLRLFVLADLLGEEGAVGAAGSDDGVLICLDVVGIAIAVVGGGILNSGYGDVFVDTAIPGVVEDDFVNFGWMMEFEWVVVMFGVI